ncbi:MAG: SMP-30/gluconolactonase/LRE family protein [Deltaproteobacteria bacterium]|nr:SMP-30/gluconolactonase/LRE family protein [Deltaproteobacteria bacterium]
MNFLWVRTATLEVHPRAAQQVSFGTVQRVDPALDAIVPAGARIEKLAEGFQFLEGPVWHRDGYLLFSDPNANTIYRYDPEGRVSVFRAKSGYKGLDVGTYHQPGSNGLTLDKEGRLVIDEHGNRRVTRLERTGALTVLADRYEGKRLNSPNDLVLKSDGTLYFTDPPFGLPKVFDDPKKELPFSGVFCLRDGKLTLLSKELAGPNGIGFSPDEKFLYVSNWDPQRKVILRFPVEAGCAVGAPTVFADLTQAPGEEALDGLKIDARGDVFVSGPGGLWIFDATGKHLGTLHPEQQPANLAWGDDGRTLYLAARTALYRIRLSVSGVTATASR